MAQTNFEDMESATGAENDNDYDLDDFEKVELEDAGDIVVGELLDVLENVGQYDARVYLFDTDDGRKMLFGNASANGGYDAIAEGDNDVPDADSIDMLGIQKTDGTYTNEYGTFAQYEVRFTDA